MARCYADSASGLLAETRKEIYRASQLGDHDALIDAWTEFERQARRLIRDAQASGTISFEDSPEDGLAERMVTGQMTIDDWLLARVRGWPLEKLEALER